MKKIVYILALGFSLFTMKLAAQPTWDMPQIVVPDMGDNFCVPIQVMDFTDLQVIRFSVNWDPNVITYTSTTSFNALVPNLSMANIDDSMAGDGILTFSWEVPGGCNAAMGVTLPDFETLFEMCFTATGIYGDHTVINITDDPVERYVSRLNANCNDIGEFSDSTHVNVDVQPLKLIASSTNGNEGDVVCVSISVEDFLEMVSVQYSINWDPTKLALVPNGATPTDLLPNFVVGPNVNISDADQGVITVSWFDADQGYTLPDGTTMLDLCFEILGNCGNNIPIEITQVPTIFEAVNSTSSNDPNLQGKDMGIFPSHGEVAVNCFTPGGVEVNIPDYNANPGEDFCIDVTAGANFTDLAELNFTLSWNPSVISLTDVTNILQQSSCPTGIFGDVINTFPSQGYLTFEYKNNFPGCDLNPGEVLFTLCFKAIGPGGSTSNVSLVNAPVEMFADKTGGQSVNIGVNANNGIVKINQLQSITVIAESMDAQPGQQVCLDFTVQDFKDVEFMNFTINWETDVLEFVEVTNFGLPDMEDFNFLKTVVGSGALGVEWGSAPTTVTDNHVIFTVCFNVVGDPGTCTPVAFSDVPYPIDVQTTGSNGTNVGMNGQGGQVCVLDPFSFEVNIGDGFGTPNAITCVDFSVKNFNELTQMDYLITWDPQIMDYDHVELTGGLPDFTAASYDDAMVLVEDGKLHIDWQTGNGIFGTTVPDGTVIFQVCFKIKAFFPNCSDIIITGNDNPPSPVLVTSATTGPANIGLTYQAGQVCATNGLDVTATVTPEACVGANTAAIDVQINGGSGSYTYSWENTETGDTFDTEDLVNIPAGEYSLTVCDVPNPNICKDTTITVGLAPNATIADAGPDVYLPCGGAPLAQLDGSGSSVGQDITYHWEVVSGSPLITSGGDTPTPEVAGVGVFQLTVTNTTTGCVTTDQTRTIAPQSPSANIADPDLLKCDPDTVVLDASNSTVLQDYEVEWVTENGGTLADPATTDVMATALTPGDYTIIITNPQSGCTDSYTVTVSEDKTPPTADAGADQSLGCQDINVVLNGDNSSTGADFTYQWQAVSGGNVCGPDDEITATACAAGTYELMVTNLNNGCTAADQVVVVADTLKPLADAGLPKTITCADPMVQLEALASTGPEYIYMWTTIGGGNIVSGDTTLTPVVDAPGDYQLTVMNTSNGCASVSEVVVDENVVFPDVFVAQTAVLLNCDNPTDTLDGSQTPLDANLLAEWKDQDGMPITSDLKWEVTAPGTYSLVVTNQENGCSTTVEAEVTEDKTPPTVDAGPSMTLTCTDKTLQLQGTTNGDGIIWSGPVGGIQSGTQNLPTPTVTKAGTYTMTVENSVNGCIAMDTVVVEKNTLAPEPVATALDVLSCKNNCTDLQLTLNNAADVPNYSVQWIKTTDGTPMGTTDVVQVCEPVSFTVTVTNMDNGCTKSAFVTPDSDFEEPVAAANNAGDVTCLNPFSSLDATGSDLQGTTLLWTTTDGNIPAGMETQPMIDQVPAGTYTLTVTFESNGCSATAETTVMENTTPPTANAGADVGKDCGVNTVMLDGSASSQGAGFTYQWFFGGEILSGATTLTPEVNQTGEYTLVVTDETNGCTAESKTTVFETFEGGEPAIATTDHEPCTDVATFTGNLPDGATGVWALTAGSADLSGIDLTSPQITVTGLSDGVTTFTWTLSLGVCENYSTATVSVDLSSATPNANPDVVTVAPEESRTLDIDLLANDQTNGLDVVPTIVSPPLVGTIDNISDGVVTYSAPKGYFGEVEFSYAICNPICPDHCDTTFVKIDFQLPDGVDCSLVPSGITPNGDGVNDEFVVVEGLEFLYPDNRLMVFNRWGDVVYEAHPYKNDWNGTGQGNKELPSGTYYYILTLDLAKSQICRGDITIMK
ncbi:MAG: hypothetical protein D6714_09510 [Bacteroidetes bacterium]|nr:MAG: hypothetical protein D6714_09510 [Bacteroidota bacterium]